jgi:hypothetical protein
MHRTVGRVTGLVVLTLAVCLSLGADEAAKQLFNGKDLSGWEGDTTFWSVEDGVIIGRTTPEKPTKKNTFLIWKGGTVGDFELTLKYKIDGGNSGIQYRSKDMGDHVVSGYQADIVAGDPDKYSGILYEEKGRGILAERGQAVTITNEKDRAKEKFADGAELAKAIKKGDWNEYKITARGNHLVHEINGAKTIDVKDNESAKAAKEGILALQIHTGPPMTIQFKDIALKTLK